MNKHQQTETLIRLVDNSRFNNFIETNMLCSMAMQELNINFNFRLYNILEWRLSDKLNDFKLYKIDRRDPFYRMIEYYYNELSKLKGSRIWNEERRNKKSSLYGSKKRIRKTKK
jgi:hypothetical protein